MPLKCSRMRGEFSVVNSKMASAKSLEDMLSSDIDESAVSALVGSLESQLSSSNIHLPSQELAPTAVMSNHVNSTPVADGTIQRLHDGQKHVVPVVNLSQGNSVTNSSKAITTNTAIVGLNSVVAATSAPSNTVMVTLPGALPASGYINQVTSSTQQALLNTAASIAAGRSVSSNPDIKIVYSPQAPATQFTTTGVSPVNNTVIQAQRSKVASVPNGSTGTVNLNMARSVQPLVTVTSVTPVITGTTVSSAQMAPGATISAIQNLANVASQQAPLIISNNPSTATTASQHALPSQPMPSTPLNIASSKQLATARLTVREQLEQKQVGLDKFSMKPQVLIKDGPLTVLGQPQDPCGAAAVPTPQSVQSGTSLIQVSASSSPTVITVSKPVQSQAHQPVNVVMSNPNLLPGVQIVNVNPGRPGTPGLGGQKTLAPRMVIGNPVRLAATPQVLTARPGTPGVQVAGQNTITLQPGMMRGGTLLVKTENGQLQVVNVAPSLPPSSAASAIPGTPYRLQSVQPGTQTVRTLAPQQMTVTLPVSVSSAPVKSAQQVASGAPQTVVGTVLQHGQPGLNVVTPVAAPATAGGTSMQPLNQALGPQTVTVKVSGPAITTSTVTHPLSIQTTTANSQSATTPSQMSPNTAKKKCKNFLSTLIRLASDQPEQVATNVKNLIQGLIDGTIQPEDFTNQLQKELNSSPQPCLVPFLKKSLPYLRHSLMMKELTIEGVRPPPHGAVTLPPTSAVIPQIQIAQARPTLHPSATQVRVMAPVPGNAFTAQLTQPGGLQGVIAQKQLTQLVAPRMSTAIATPAKSLLVATAPSMKGMTHNMSLASPAALSPATVGALQSKVSGTARAPLAVASASTQKADKGKRSYSALSRDDDDINDVAAMGGVNLVEESQRILASNAEIVGTQIRSCKDENFLFTVPLQKRINSIVAKYGLDETPGDVVALISHAAQERLKSLVAKLGVIAEHRLENIKTDSRLEPTQDVKVQLKFLEELDRLEKKRHEEQEREMLLRAAKSRSKLEDPEQLKLKQKAKEMQRAEMEELRQREANMTALLAIGPRKKLKTDAGGSGASQLGLTGLAGLGSSVTKPQMRPRVKRVNIRDLLFLMEHERETVRTPFLYKSYLK